MMFERKFFQRNGARIAVHPRKGESFSMRLITLGGKAEDPEGMEGLTGLAASLILHGCMGRPYSRIVESLESTGTSLYFSAGLESAQASFWALRDFAEEGLAILRDCLSHPDFPPEELEKEKNRAISELRRIWDEPEEAASRIFAGKIFPSHPYSRLETASSLSRIERENLERRMEELFLASSTFIALAGEESLVERALELVLDALKEGKRAFDIPSPQPGPAKYYFYLKEDAEQVQIRMGHPSFPRNFPYYEEALLMNYILGGGGFSSRLMERIRAKEGLTYSIRSSFSPMLRAGLFSISTFTRPENTARTIEAIVDEVRRMVREGVREEEVEKAKSYYIGHFPLSLETTSQVSSLLSSMLFYGLGEDYPERFLSKIRGLTARQINPVIARVLFPENLVTVVVGNEQALKQLEKMGEVEQVLNEGGK